MGEDDRNAETGNSPEKRQNPALKDAPQGGEGKNAEAAAVEQKMQSLYGRRLVLIVLIPILLFVLSFVNFWIYFIMTFSGAAKTTFDEHPGIPVYGLSARPGQIALESEAYEISVYDSLEISIFFPGRRYGCAAGTSVLKNVSREAQTAQVFFPFENLKRRYLDGGNKYATKAPEALWNGAPLQGDTVLVPDSLDLSGCTLEEAESFALSAEERESTEKAFAVYKIPLAAGEAGTFCVRLDFTASRDARVLQFVDYRAGTGFQSVPEKRSLLLKTELYVAEATGGVVEEVVPPEQKTKAGALFDRPDRLPEGEPENAHGWNRYAVEGDARFTLYKESVVPKKVYEDKQRAKWDYAGWIALFSVAAAAEAGVAVGFPVGIVVINKKIKRLSDSAKKCE